MYCLSFSPQSGVTLCFQFVSTAFAAAKNLASHIKTVCAEPYIFGTRNMWVWGNALDDLSMTLTQSCSCDSDWQKLLVCTVKWEPLIQSLQNLAFFFNSSHAHYMLTLWGNFVGNFFLDGYWVYYVTLTFDFTYDLDLGFCKVKFEIALSQGLLVWLLWNEKEENWWDTGLTVWPCPLTTPMTLIFKFQGQITSSQE